MKVVGGEVVMLVSGTIRKWSSVGSGDELDESNRSVCVLLLKVEVTWRT
jgi:hypothetical protein